jgi:predicted glycoside hydrolase/deacetylase ChbG (UPF0249 family)
VKPSGAQLVVNADDFGLSPGVCAGILRAHEHGIVTSSSALVNAPAFGRHASSLRDSGMGVGVHLCLVGEDPPLLAAREIPTIVDRNGRLPSSWKRFAAGALTGRVDPADVRRELSAQIAAATDHGLAIDHLDGHQHLHLMPDVSEVVLELARRCHVPAVRIVGTRSLRPPAVLVRPLAARMRRRARAAGLIVPDRAAGLDTAGRLDLDALSRAVSALACESGVADLTTHPGADPDPERERYTWGYSWTEELQALCAPRARQAIEDAGFTLTDYRELARTARR